jgi:hypothetical protein
MANLDAEIIAYEAMRADLEAHHMGKWTLINDGKLIGVYDSLDAAAQDAVKLFGRGHYLIRQVGSTSVTLPASVMYRIA